MKLTVLLFLITSYTSCVRKFDESKVIDADFPTSVSFKCEQFATIEDNTIPVFSLTLKTDLHNFSIDTIPGCQTINPSEYSTYQIPVDSSILDAKGGWFAGYGNYYYCKRRENSLMIYKGWQDEMQEDEGFHYTLFKIFTFRK